MLLIPGLLPVFSIYQLYLQIKDMKIWQQVLAQQMKPLRPDPGATMGRPSSPSHRWGKSLTEGASAYAKAGSSLRRPPVPKNLPPKTRVCLIYCVMLSTYSSDINRGLSPHHLFLEKVNLELLNNKSPGHSKSVSIPKPL